MRKYYISKFFALSVILMMNLNLINAQSRSIKGYVCNDSGDRLPGAIVRLVGEDDNIITDANGEFSALYENGMDVTLAYEHEMNYRHAWEFFANGYLKWTECKSCGHICPESFWRNYHTYGFGVAYKPCVVRGRNHYGNLRIGASAGSDTNKFLAGIHVGYEHNYVLRSGCTLFWQVKSDMMIKGADLLRTGIVLGVKLPIK